MTDLSDAHATEVKSCCAALYEMDWVRLLLGESLHPGGLELTERLGHLLALEPGMIVLDVACGPGVSALHVARTFGCRVIGVDLGAGNVAAAGASARQAGLEGLADFRWGDAEALPLADATVDVVLCECAFCTFPNKAQAAREFFRVLRPGGRIGLSDLTRCGALPRELEGLLAWVACLADARPAEEYVTYLQDAGFEGTRVEPHDEALMDLVTSVQQKLIGAELLLELGVLSIPGIDSLTRLGPGWPAAGRLDQAKTMAKASATSVRAGQLGYTIITAATDQPPASWCQAPASRVQAESS